MSAAMALIYPALALATTAASAAAYVWYQKPSVAIRLLIRFGLRRAGMTVHYADLRGGEVMCYAERGSPSSTQPSIVFIHGFSASKDNWLTILQRLPRDIHAVAVDMIGHGDSSLPVKGHTPSPQYLTECLHELLVKQGIVNKPVHLVGTSMGGLIGSMYTSSYPQDVLMFSAICPAGYMPEVTEKAKAMRTGKNYLLPKTAEDMSGLLDLVLYHKHRVPRNKQMLKGFIQMKENSSDFFHQLFISLTENMKEDVTTKLYSSINRPVQILWGLEDELLHVSGAEFMKSKLSDCRRVDLIEQCGHAMTWDQPRKVTNAILEFRATILSPAAEQDKKYQ